jgi:hypothetical protein
MNLQEQYKKLFKGKAGSNDKGLLKEAHAWERTPGKPLPTLKDVTEKHNKSFNEATVSGKDLVLTLTVPMAMFQNTADELEAQVIVDSNDANQLKQLAATMEDDLQTWFERNGDQWLEEGMSEGVYDDFVTL